MYEGRDKCWTFEITLGENRWEEFYLIQDSDPEKRIYPHVMDAGKDDVTVGPHNGGAGHFWLLDGRDRVDIPEEQIGKPGDKYLITFSWKTFKELTWKKLEGEQGAVERCQYFLAGTWSDFDLVELEPDASRRRGWYRHEVQMTSLGIEFKLVCNEDYRQLIHPVPKPGERAGDMMSSIRGPDATASAANWRVQDSQLGGVYALSFFRDPEDCEPVGMRVEWRKIGERPVVEPDPAYYMIGPFNDWGAKGMQKMRHQPNDFSVFSGDVAVEEMEERKVVMPFKIVQHKIPERCVHPDKDKCTMFMEHSVVMDNRGKDRSWLIGAAASDKAKLGDVFTVTLQIATDGGLSVSWGKRAE